MARPAPPVARRESPAAGVAVDFACVEAWPGVEVDGRSHEPPEGRAREAWRDRCLRDASWRVVRVPDALAIAGGDLAPAPMRAA